MFLTNSNLCKTANNTNLKLHNFGYASVNKQWCGYVQNPPVSRLYYISCGRAQITYDNQALNLTHGHWYLLPAGFSFGFNCAHEMEHLYFHITLSGQDEIDLLRNIKLPIHTSGTPDTVEFLKRYLTVNTLTAALMTKEKVYNIILKLIEITNELPEVNAYSPCVQKALEYINNNLYEKLNLSIIADAVYVSKCTLTNKFKKELNITVQEYINEQRMFKAAQMLNNTKISIGQISEKLGFSDQFYFSRCFKHKYGLSPREYRKSKID